MTNAPPPPAPPTRAAPPRLLATDDDARAAVARLAGEPLVAVDTETGWDDSLERHRLALVQVAAPGDVVAVIDATAVDPEVLRPLVERDGTARVAHNARFDTGVLRAAGYLPRGFVDTLHLARAALDLPAHGLADVVHALFGATLDKSLQRSAWLRRPLSPAQLAYAAGDAVWTLRVYEALRARLEAAGEWDDALRRATIAPADPDAPPRAPRKKRPPAPADAPPLTPAEKRVVAALKTWRMAYARAAKVPVYRVCPDRTLEELARARPASRDALTAVYGLGEAKAAQFGDALLEALRAALAAVA